MAFPSRLRLATFSLLALVAAFGPVPELPAAIDSAQPRVIVVLWDGAQRNHFLELYNTGQLPNLQALVEEGGFEHQACNDDTRNLWIAADRAVLISKAGVDPYQTSIGPTLFDIHGMDKNVSPRFPAQSLYDDGKPPIPVLSPIDNPDGSGSYRVEWTATLAAESYTLEESGTSDFAAPIPRYTGPDPVYDVTDQPSGTWYYRVLASNQAGDSPWSNVQSVAVVPGAPTLLPIDSPGGGASYLVDWEDVTGAVTYTLEEDSIVGFPLPAARYAGPGTEFQVTGQSPGTWYYRVGAANELGRGPWSGTEWTAVAARIYLPIVRQHR